MDDGRTGLAGLLEQDGQRIDRRGCTPVSGSRPSVYSLCASMISRTPSAMVAGVGVRARHLQHGHCHVHSFDYFSVV